MIKSAWSTEDGFNYNCTVPEGAVATLALPVFSQNIIINGKEYSGAEFEQKDGRYIISLASGSYEFKQ